MRCSLRAAILSANPAASAAQQKLRCASTQSLRCTDNPDFSAVVPNSLYLDCSTKAKAAFLLCHTGGQSRYCSFETGTIQRIRQVILPTRSFRTGLTVSVQICAVLSSPNHHRLSLKW